MPTDGQTKGPRDAFGGRAMAATAQVPLADIALVIGIPASPAELAGRFTKDPADQDYAWRLAETVCPNSIPGDGTRPLSASEAVTLAAQVASAPNVGTLFSELSRLVDTATAAKVTVFRDADLSDLARAGQFNHVCLFTHWKGHWITQADFKGVAWAALACAARHAWAGFAPGLPGYPDPQSPQDLRKTLNSLVEAGCAMFPSSEEERALEDQNLGISYDADFMAAMNREFLDDAFGSETLRPGNRLELSDGLARPDHIAAAIGDATQSVSLMACHSNVLQQVLATERPNLRVVGTTMELTPTVWAAFVAHVFESARDGRTPFLMDLVHGIRDLSQRGQKAVRASKGSW